MEIIIHGPNLADQSKGSFVAHAADCRDNARVRYLFNHGSDGGYKINVASCYEAAEAVYGDFEKFEDNPDSYIADIHFAPCCDALPLDAIAVSDDAPPLALTRDERTALRAALVNEIDTWGDADCAEHQADNDAWVATLRTLLTRLDRA